MGDGVIHAQPEMIKKSVFLLAHGSFLPLFTRGVLPKEYHIPAADFSKNAQSYGTPQAFAL